MSRSRRTLIHAPLDEISPWTAALHSADAAKVAAIVAHVGDGPWTLPPVLVIESEGNGATVLDGHHRTAAARALGIDRIPAYVVTVADYCRVIERHFAGESPARLGDLDDFIRVNGKPYRRPEDGVAR